MAEQYCVWPDGTVCELDALAGCLMFKSDDYVVVWAQDQDDALVVAGVQP